ncbi:MAG: hypothetical protein IPF59_11070 [Ignavibacteria bacterium]|nr:hypothetical protein [Ignavibacteria bacterium]MBK6417815.1 hypothetical protein [Ignavibacteria bacterium]MBK7031849.1 hypothetical protein [Ignavibacteria bacterium]MBK7411322.1 hypothetical protein [Ignavibacteria bacterium]
MQKHHTLVFVALVFVVLGCEPGMITYQNLRTLQKGMTHEQVAREITKNPKKRDTILVGGQSYVIDEYSIVTLQYQSTSYYPSSTGNVAAGTYRTEPITTTTDITNIFVCLFEKDKLRYWGMIGDFSKSEDDEMQRVAPFVHDLFFKEAP